MEILTGLLLGGQFVFLIVAVIYFTSSMQAQKGIKSRAAAGFKKESSDLLKLRAISLTEPLAEKARPSSFGEIVGQDKGVKALCAALCGPNPQHVIIYGAPGIGKTAAARLALEYAKKNALSPFAGDAPFIEIDATILQFDERSIADPLIGSVHDPIYQGAGAFGAAGVPQPKPGAVTRAHGGVMFLDEIGELHKIQMNKLLKVLEDRKVFLSSSYYSEDDENVPKYVHDIFKNGLPADFRLIGATTRQPEEIPDALRSRCTEIFFRPLNSGEVKQIARNAFAKAGCSFDAECVDYIASYSQNGRDTVNIVQTAVSLATLDGRPRVTVNDIEEVVEYGGYSPRAEQSARSGNAVGTATGLAVCGGRGSLLEIEVKSSPAREEGRGELKATGIIEEEELQSRGGQARRVSSVKNSIDNAVSVLNHIYKIDARDYDIHINFPGGAPVDGPSAGAAIFLAVYSSLTGTGVPCKTAITGEITLSGKIAPVGGVRAKIEAAACAGIQTVLIPVRNYQQSFRSLNINVVTVESVGDVLAAIAAE